MRFTGVIQQWEWLGELVTANSIEVANATPWEIVGGSIVHAVISLAQMLTKSEAAPGLVAAFLLVCLIGAAVWYWLRTTSQLSAIRSIQLIVNDYPDIPAFAEKYVEFQGRVRETKADSKSSRELWDALDEFSETIVLDDMHDGPAVMRNSIRPASFMNIDDLGFGQGFFRILPNLFVSLGLLLTFLGLVAALHQFSQTMTTQSAGATELDSAMTSFMQIASAKFIMSLVGLVCSILFTALLRWRSGALDSKLHKLCLSIERRLVFVSLEDIGFRQLKANLEQREHLKEIGYGMVAELRAPLEALPEHISKSISDQMDPIFEKVSNMGTSSMEGLVGDLSSQLSHSVGNALNNASESLGEASDRIAMMLDRMGDSQSRAGNSMQESLSQMSETLADLRTQVGETGRVASSAMNEGAERMLAVMNETLGGIRENTSQGARAMSEAAEEMRRSAEGFREQLNAAASDGAALVEARMVASSDEAGRAIDGAGKSLLASFEDTSREIASLGVELGSRVNDELMSSIGGIGQQLEAISSAIELSVSGVRNVTSSLNDGARMVEQASSSFGTSSRDLVSATSPLRDSHERIESSLRTLSNTVEATSSMLVAGSRSVADGARNVLETASAALGNEREGIRRSLEATRAAIAQLSEEAEKLDNIDEMLGRALTSYNSQLEAALSSAQEHVVQMRDEMAPALDTLKGVVEQAESFIPVQPRRF